MLSGSSLRMVSAKGFRQLRIALHIYNLAGCAEEDNTPVVITIHFVERNPSHFELYISSFQT